MTAFLLGLTVGALAVAAFIPVFRLEAYCRGRRDQRLDLRVSRAWGRL